MLVVVAVVLSTGTSSSTGSSSSSRATSGTRGRSTYQHNRISMLVPNPLSRPPPPHTHTTRLIVSVLKRVGVLLLICFPPPLPGQATFLSMHTHSHEEDVGGLCACSNIVAGTSGLVYL